MMNDWWNGGWGWGMWFMPLMTVIFVAAVIVAVVFVVRALSNKGPSQQVSPLPPEHVPSATSSARGPLETPKEVLQRRYAAGEIEREEYLQKLEDLGP